MRAAEATGAPVLHPLHAILMAFPLALFAAGLVSDIAYLKTAAVQWSNFSAWLIAGALLVGGGVLAWAIVETVFPRRTERPRALAYLAAVAIMWIAGLINAFQHSHDGWSAVGVTGVTLSVISTLAALVAAGIGYSGQRAGRIVR